MSTLHLSDTLLDIYVTLFQQLEPQDQTILLNTLTGSVKKNFSEMIDQNDKYPVYHIPKPVDAPAFEELAGSWEDDRSADEIMEDIRQSRTRNREVNL